MTKICSVCKRELPLNMFKKIRNKYFLNKCKSCSAKEKAKGISYYEDDITDEMVVSFYQKLLKGDISRLPNMISKNKNYSLILLKYLFKDILKCKTKIDVCEKFNGKTINKYKLQGVINKNFNSIFEPIQLLFPQYNIKPWELKYGNIHGMYNSDKNKKECIEWFLNNLIKDKCINNYIDIIKIDNIYELFQKYSINGLLKSSFNNSSTKCLMWYFNNFTKYKIYEWDFKTPPRNFWNNKNNCIRAFRYVLESEGLNIMTSYDEDIKAFIIDNIQKETFEKYNVLGAYKSFKNIYEITKATFGKELFYQWELKYTPSSFWKKKENRHSALIQLIQALNLSDEDIPKCLYQGLLRKTKYNKFNTICTIYYKGNFYYWLNEIYPNKFNFEDFNIKTYDEIIFSSREELLLYKYIKNNINNNILYIGNKKYKKYFFNNIKYNENYRPDFVINNTKKDIIIEYFGLYYPNSSSNIVKQYVLKTNRKIEYFNSLDNIYFISIFPNDLKDNFKGLNEKVKEFRLQGCELF